MLLSFDLICIPLVHSLRNDVGIVSSPLASWILVFFYNRGKLNMLPSFRHINWRIDVNNKEGKWFEKRFPGSVMLWLILCAFWFCQESPSIVQVKTKAQPLITFSISKDTLNGNRAKTPAPSVRGKRRCHRLLIIYCFSNEEEKLVFLPPYFVGFFSFCIWEWNYRKSRKINK